MHNESKDNMITYDPLKTSIHMSAELLNKFCLLFGPFLTGQMVVESHSVPRLSEGGESDIDELLISSAKIRVDVYRS